MAESQTGQSVLPAQSLPDTSCSGEEAAVFLLLLGEQAAANVIKHFTPGEVRAISQYSEKLQVKNRDQLILMLNQFAHSYANVSLLLGDYQIQMRQVLQKALGKEQARCLVNPPGSHREPLTGLQLMKPELLATMIRDEPEQFQAAVLACLQSDQASDVINLLPRERVQGILERIAHLGNLSQASLQAIVTFLQSFLNEQAIDQFLPVNGEQQVANILNLFDTDLRNQVLLSLKRSDSAMAVRIEEQMLVFAQVIHLSVDNVARLVASVDPADLTMALKGETDDVRQHIYQSMSKRAANYLREEMEVLGAVPQSKVKEARQRVVQVMDDLLKSGVIEMPRSNEVMLE
ncbi:flagellar motor switch protein FliG [Endozoicomonas sp. SESOKO1]|uniref:flagellar motor switch protein FliG n=1 Tax=Endozoicomonas sp. SESOKO1 TaxID=2828742 RepID=UPI00214845AD|nr:FliG C-terminal domain-containing protein [Endozoicomonas sp. SESOKO1]